MYTIESHLESFKETEFELLSSNWKLNKNQLKSAQIAVYSNFPHYSKHESSHSDTIIRNIESFLGEEGIRKLTPTDSWLILMSAYTHDLGMVVFHEDIEAIWKNEFLSDHIPLLTESKDEDLRNAAILIAKVEKGDFSSDHQYISLSLEIRRALILLTAEYFRKIHHEKSKSLLTGGNKIFSDLLNSFHANDLPNRFTVTLGEIAYSHGTSFDSTIERLEFIADGIKNDKMHPRLVACLLRLGDLLDVDDKRFNPFILKSFSAHYPSMSEQHRLKHASTRHLLITPEAIEITVDCPTEEVFRIAGQWFEWLEKEVRDQSRDWSIIAPKIMQLPAPSIPKGKLKILYNSILPKPEFVDLKFRMSTNTAFSILEGGALYQNVGLVPFREVLQNAIDATKVQLWQAIQEGIYDKLLIAYHNLPIDISHEDILNKIKFPADIPSDIWESFPISLSITRDNSRESIIVTVVDRGTGISDSDIFHLTNKVGESKWKTAKNKKLIDTTPYWLRPTGAFGVGLQSIFLLTKSFTIKTKASAEFGKEVTFKTPKEGDYSHLINDKLEIPRGTTIKFEFKEHQLSKTLPGKIDYYMYDSFDLFSDKYQSIYLYIIEKYLIETFSHIPYLNIDILGNKILGGDEKKIRYMSVYWNDGPVIDSDKRENRILNLRSCRLPQWNYQEWHYFEIQESLLGSQLHLLFPSNLTANQRPISLDLERNDNLFLVRDIPLKEEFPSFYRTTFCNVVWNLQTPSSDTLLRISRDYFLENKKEEIQNEFTHKVFPEAVKVIHDYFVLNHSKIRGDLEGKANEYLFICLTAKMCQISIDISKDLLDNFHFPVDILTFADATPVKFIQLLEESHFIDIQIQKTTSPALTIEEKRKEWDATKQQLGLDFGIIFWTQKHLANYPSVAGYKLSKAYTLRRGTYDCTVKVVSKEKSSYVETNNLFRETILMDIFKHEYSNRRIRILPLDPYDQTIVVYDSFDGFRGESPLNRTDYIISPFKSLLEFTNLYETIKDLVGGNNHNIVETIVTQKLVEFVPEDMISWVMENRLKNKHVSDSAKVKTGYISLIIEMITIHHNNKR